MAEIKETPRVLAVDDEPAVLDLIKGILRKAGYKVSTAENAQKAIQTLNDTQHDCVVTDIIMPEVSGTDLVQMIRSHPYHHKIPILMLSRKRDLEAVQKAIQSGASDYLIKPIDPQLLLDKVERSISKGGGKSHVFQLKMTGPNAELKGRFKAKIKTLSEAGVSIISPVPIQDATEVVFDFDIFDKIKMNRPMMKWLSCRTDSQHSDAELFEVQYLFVGLTEQELQKMRAWLQKEAVKQKPKDE